MPDVALPPVMFALPFVALALPPLTAVLLVTDGLVPAIHGLPVLQKAAAGLNRKRRGRP